MITGKPQKIIGKMGCQFGVASLARSYRPMPPITIRPAHTLGYEKMPPTAGQLSAVGKSSDATYLAAYATNIVGFRPYVRLIDGGPPQVK